MLLARMATPAVRPAGKRQPTLGARASPGWTYTTSGFWDGHRYYERIDGTKNPNHTDDKRCFQEGCFYAHDVVDFGFLDLVRTRRTDPRRLHRGDVAGADRLGLRR